MLKKYQDLIECANAITDEEIDDAWNCVMPSDIDPFLNALFDCIYEYRHPEFRREREKTCKDAAENAKLVVEALRKSFDDFTVLYDSNKLKEINERVKGEK